MVDFQSESAMDLEDEFHKVVDVYLELCAAIGKEPQKEYSGLFNLRSLPELHRSVPIFAQAEGITFNKTAEQAIRALAQG